MYIEKLCYDVKVQVQLTPGEVDYLIARCKVHYDYVCKAAGTSIADGGFENGFIAQMKLFPNLSHVLSSRQLDIMLKILETYTDQHDQRMQRAKLFDEVMAAFDTVQARYKQLRDEETLVKR